MASNDVSFVQALVDEFLNQVRRGEMEAVANWYAEDAIVLPPGSPRIDGRSGVSEYWSVAHTEIAEFDMTVTDVRRHSNELLEEIGVWSMRMRSDALPAIGKYVSILRKYSGDWKVSTDIWNEGV